jgi:trans-AT polyketide synthase/acyltransferase/oxidoreductase domain-containing protein
MTVFVFPGQGSQFKGMGAGLFEQFPDIVQQADALLGYSIKTLCLEDPQQRLNQTQYTQPALYTVNALYTLQQRMNNEQRPSFVAGHSLGEYNALLAAGVIDFITGLTLVKKRGELMAKMDNGGMAAVLASGEVTQALLKKHQLVELDIANFNSPKQTVISGSKTAIENAKNIFTQQENIILIPLTVSAAFHSRYMDPIKDEFNVFLQTFSFAEAKIPVIANVTARPYQFDAVIDNLGQQISGSVQWVDSIRYLMGQGETSFIEVGPKNVLSKLVDEIQANCPPIIDGEATPNKKPQLFEQARLPGGDICAAKAKPNKIITAESLGCRLFKEDYGLKYAYISGAMAKGISSVDVVVSMGKAGLMGFFGSGGLGLEQIETAIQTIQQQLNQGEAYGINVLHHPDDPDVEGQLVDLLLNHNVRCAEASAFMQITPALVKYRLSGIYQTPCGQVRSKNKLIAKLSRPEIANLFLAPPPQHLVDKLLNAGKISPEAAALAAKLPMADDICVEADSGGHTDMGIMTVLLPAIIQLRDECTAKGLYAQTIRVGAGGGIGTPQAAAAAFILGADFILTGSVNQCSVEADTSAAVKDILQTLNVQDTDYAPAGDMFEIGARVQVVRKGIFFPARANKLYELYRQYPSIEAIDEKTKGQLQKRFFQRSFNEVYEDVVAYRNKVSPHELEKAAQNPKHKMALIFKWYFAYSSRLAKQGDLSNKIDFQIHSGPAMGLVNQWVKGTELESWQNRRVADLAEKIMQGTAEYLQYRIDRLYGVA